MARRTGGGVPRRALAGRHQGRPSYKVDLHMKHRGVPEVSLGRRSVLRSAAACMDSAQEPARRMYVLDVRSITRDEGSAG